MAVDANVDRYAEYCNETVLNQPYPDDGNKYCKPLWDTWGCWNYTLAGETAHIQCPRHNLGFDPDLKASRICNEDGSWWIHPMSNATWANYSSCINMEDVKVDMIQLYIFYAGYSLSILFLLVSLIIFCAFRQLQCDRITIHKNLFISYIFNGIAWIIYKSLMIFDGQTQIDNPIWCQIVHVSTQYFTLCNYFWMFCEGFYLHMIIVMAFMAGKKILISCYAIGWAWPVLFTSIYTITRALSQGDNDKCWVKESTLQWIIAGPIVLSIVVNFIFLIIILNVLLTKLRSVQTPDSNSYRKASKAILILIPLLGLQYLLFPMKIASEGPLYTLYLYTVAIVTSCQGMVVALIFCFFNGEVHTVLKRKWGQHRLMSRNNHNQRSTYFTSMTDQNPSLPSKSILKKSHKDRKNSAHRKDSAPSNYCPVDFKATDKMLEENHNV